jgi:predicted DNA-binding protein YlxM (UPF0122 family)
MGYNLYSLNEEELNQLCVKSLFDRKSTKILNMIIWDEEPIKNIASELRISEQAVYSRIDKIKQKLKIKKWTDSLD